MKTTIYLPEVLYRRAKAKAALEKKTMRLYLTEALESKLSIESKSPGSDKQKSWVDRLPKLPPGAANEVSKIVKAADFRKVDESMWE